MNGYQPNTNRLHNPPNKGSNVFMNNTKPPFPQTQIGSSEHLINVIWEFGCKISELKDENEKLKKEIATLKIIVNNS